MLSTDTAKAEVRCVSFDVLVVSLFGFVDWAA